MVELEKTKEDIIKKAYELAVQYEAKYKGCAQCTYLAIIDALRWGGLELIPRDMEERFFSGVCLFTGGVSMAVDGTCGAVTSSVLAIGLALGIRREGQDDAALRKGCAVIRDTILDRYYREYNSMLCKDVQRKFFGKSWDLSNDDASKEFLQVSQGCVIMQTAMWATEIILDEYEKGNVRLPA